jgi:uncharacterized protein YukE
MSEFIGMDPDVVDSLAGNLEIQGNALLQVLSQIDNIVHQIGGHWLGPSASEFSYDWQRMYRPNLVKAQGDLSGLAQSAKNNAKAQSTTSNAQGGGISNSGNLGVWNPNGGPSAQSQTDKNAILAATKRNTAQENIAWWQGISQSQRKEYLENAPGVLGTLSGLGAYVAVYKNTPATQIDQEGEAEVTIKTWFGSGTVGGDDQIVVTENANGTATVQVGGGLFAGVSKNLGDGSDGGSAGLEGEVGGSRTYEFQSTAQAQAFYNQLIQGGPTKVPGNVAQAVKDPNLNLISETVSGKVSGNLSVSGKEGNSGGNAEVGAAVQAVYDVKKQTETVNFTVDGNAAGNLGADGMKANGDVQVSVTYDQQGGQVGSVQSVTISGNYNDSVTSGSALNNVSTGQGGSFSMEIQGNSQTQLALTNLGHQLEQGNASGVSSSIGQLTKDSTIITQSDVTAGTEVGVQYGSAIETKAESTTTVTSTTSTSIKAPGYSQTLPFP